MEKRTYYSVVYRSWGADRENTAWFDDKETAEGFASQDYRDDVKTHRVSKAETIAKYDELVARTAQEFSR